MVHIPSTVQDNDEVPYGNGLDICAYRGLSLHGTPGLIAPETIMHFDYSIKSDVWQLGCILYSLLSGQHPFSATRIDRILNAEYFPMVGNCWLTVSEPAKLLVSSMLQVDPAKRPSALEVLSNPWFKTKYSSSTSDDFNRTHTPPLDEDYGTRIKGLVLTQKLRSVFLKRDLVSRDMERVSRRDVTRGLRLHWSQGSEPQFQRPQRSQGGMLEIRADSLDDIDSMDDSEHPDDDGLTVEEKLEMLREKCREMAIIKPSSALRDNRQSRALSGRDLLIACDYQQLGDLLSQCHLQQLSSRNVYDIFVSRENGTINITDMIASLKAVFHTSDPLDVSSFDPILEDADPEDEEAQNIFRKLDTKHRGYITCEDMKIGIRCIMLAEYVKSHRKKVFPSALRRGILNSQRSSRSNVSMTQRSYKSNMSRMSSMNPASVKSMEVETLFTRLDPSMTGKIDFEAFKEFYMDMIAPSNPNLDPLPFSIEEVEVSLQPTPSEDDRENM